MKTPSMCSNCKHLNLKSVKKISCKAFPEGIPHEIIFGEIKHNTLLPDQFRDYVFEPTPLTLLKFSDGEVFITSGPIHKEFRKDGWYVVGDGLLVPVEDEIEADTYLHNHETT